MYLIAHVPSERASAEPVVRSFFDLYAFERGWQALAARAPEVDALLADLRRELFISPSAETINDLLRQRRFVVLQGPPGTGKTRLADTVRREFFGGRGLTIQFHPSVTYEDFVIGLSPDPAEGQLHFRVRPGALMEAVQQATESPFVLVVDEVNRADLGKVLGEAIYLFEAGEVGGDRAREVRLPHSVDGRSTLRLPEHLYVLGTMNTADRSIASVDLAIRRRFAFLTIPPDRAAVEQGGTPKSLEAFDRLTDVFVEHAPEDALELLPGHAYFLAPDEPTFAKRLRYEILPLLDEYLRQGYLGAASAELQAVRDSLEGQLSLDGTT
jgi:5-methylcytosine-specific restriction protein B